MEPGDPDESGRRRPASTGEGFAVAADTVVIAIGYQIDEELTEAASVTSQHGTGVIDRETDRTSRPGVFACGDCVYRADLVVAALADGRRAAKEIDCYLTSEREAVA